MGHALLEDRREVSGAVEGDPIVFLPVELEERVGSFDVGVGSVTIQGEAVVHSCLPEELRDASEAIDWELLVLVVSFDERADGIDCNFVLVGFAEGCIDSDMVE